MKKGWIVKSIKKEEGRMREIKRGLRWELSYLSVEELAEASPGEQQMNDVFLSQKYVDKRSPALPVSAPSAFSFILDIVSCFFTFSLRWFLLKDWQGVSFTKRIMLPDNENQAVFAPVPSPHCALSLLWHRLFGGHEYSETNAHDLIWMSHTSDPFPHKQHYQAHLEIIFSSVDSRFFKYLSNLMWDVP